MLTLSLLSQRPLKSANGERVSIVKIVEEKKKIRLQKQQAQQEQKKKDVAL